MINDIGLRDLDPLLFWKYRHTVDSLEKDQRLKKPIEHSLIRSYSTAVFSLQKPISKLDK